MNVDEKGNKTYTIECLYTDRGTEVPLKALASLTNTGTPKLLILNGKTSRTQKIHDSIFFDDQQVFVKQNSSIIKVNYTPGSFPIDGYAPATLKWLLINYWIQNGKPVNIHGIPNGDIEVKEMGYDTILVNDSKHIFNAYAIKDVIWGWEYIWTDQEGRLAALNTINAEGDKIEFINENYRDILLPIARLSARNGVKNYPQKNTSSAHVAIVDCSIMDLEKGEIIQHQTVLCEKGIIAWIGANTKAKTPKGAVIIKAKGRSLLPGLWDMHAHIKQTEWGPAYIGAGITTVRDMGNEFEFISSVKRSIDLGEGIGPTIFRAGIIDGVGPKTNGIIVADSPKKQ